MRPLGYIFIVWAVFLAASSIGLAEDINDLAPEVVGTVTDKEPSWYAIAKMDGKGKLYTKGDIFCSNVDITRCLRIQDVKKDELLLKDVSSENTFRVAPGKKIPLEGTEIIFEKAVSTDVVEYRYDASERPTKDKVEDFTIRDLEKKKVVLEKHYDKAALLAALSEEEREVFNAPQLEDTDTIKSSFFEDINIEKIEDDAWAIDVESAKLAIDNTGKAIISTIKKVEPRFRFREGPSLKFNCELGDIVLNRDGFLIQDLAVAKLAERAGIKQGDLIKSINGQSINSLYGIYRAYMSFKGDKDIEALNVNIIRDGRPETLTYKIR